MQWRASILGVLACTIVLPATAGDGGEPQGAKTCLPAADARAVIGQNRLLPSTVAMRNAAARVQADALAGKLCRWGEGYVYEITLLRRDGRVIHAFIDALTGKTVGTRNLD